MVFLDYPLAWSCLVLTIMRFVIPVVFYEITSIECVYSSDTTVFIATYYCTLYILYFLVLSHSTHRPASWSSGQGL